MVRTLAILIMLVSTLPGAGIGLGMGLGLNGGADPCGDSACHEPVVVVSCCGEQIVDEAYCPMSEGPCRCVVSPAPAPERSPEAPLPRPDRDTLTWLPNAPPRMITEFTAEPKARIAGSQTAALTAGRRHNEIQAILGVWRT